MSRRMIGNRKQARWEGDRLFCEKRFSGFTIEPDGRYPMMWRVRGPDGLLSGMVNRARAKDFAIDLVLAGLEGWPDEL